MRLINKLNQMNKFHFVRLFVFLLFVLFFNANSFTQPNPNPNCPFKQVQYKCSSPFNYAEGSIAVFEKVTYHFECATGGSLATCDVVDCNNVTLFTLICPTVPPQP